MMKPSHTSPQQARTSLLWRPCSRGFQGPRRLRIIRPIVRFTRYSSVWWCSRLRACCPNDASLTPASTRPQSDPTRTYQSTRRGKAASYVLRSRCMSVSAATMTHATPSMPTGMPTVMRGRRLAVATTLIVVDATTAARTEARALTCWDLRPLADTSSTLFSHRGTDRRPTSQNTPRKTMSRGLSACLSSRWSG